MCALCSCLLTIVSFLVHFQNLLQKVAQLEDAWAKKERFIQSTRMIVKFREEHIARLEKTLKESGRCLGSDEKDAVIDHLKQEIKALREQVRIQQ